MNKDIVTMMLNSLADLVEQRDAVVAAHPLREQYLALKVEMEDMQAAFDEAAMPLDAQILTVKAQITEAVLALQETVKGVAWQAVYAKPRATWDSQKLEGYAAAHPEIVAFKRVGEPGVSFRAVTK